MAYGRIRWRGLVYPPASHQGNRIKSVFTKEQLVMLWRLLQEIESFVRSLRNPDAEKIRHREQRACAAMHHTLVDHTIVLINSQIHIVPFDAVPNARQER